LAYRIKGRLTDNYHKGHMIHARLLLNWDRGSIENFPKTKLLICC
jgi:hypothetical protein